MLDVPDATPTQLEEQALAQLRDGPDDRRATARSPPRSATHLAETESHERMIARAARQARDAGPSRFKDAVMTLGGKGFVLFARAQPGHAGQARWRTRYAYEALEEASYELLARVAEHGRRAPTSSSAARADRGRGDAR